MGGFFGGKKSCEGSMVELTVYSLSIYYMYKHVIYEYKYIYMCVYIYVRINMGLEMRGPYTNI